MSIKNTTLAATATTVYTSNGESAVSTIYFCNTFPTALTINVYAVPAGDTANESNIIYFAVTIAPQDTFILDTERLMLDNGDSLVAAASVGWQLATGGIVATISYVGI